MIDFNAIKDIRIPEGYVEKIEHGGTVLWGRPFASLVAFGDSIAGGHAIDENWAKDYGPTSQYGVNDNTETEIVPGCYTDLMRADLTDYYGSGHTRVTSFARSGDRVDDLIVKMGQTPVVNMLGNATLVTACIGANDVLEPALSHLDEYINYGDLTELTAIVEANLARLADDSDPNSYRALFDKMKAVNPNAKYAFMTIYNPYKYLWLDEGTWDNEYRDSFFGPLLDTIPQMSVLGLEIDRMIKKGLLQTSAVRTLYSRVNGLCDYSENLVNKLNDVLRGKIAEAGSNFVIAEAKAAFDVVPDRPVSAPYHYNDLVNVEFTRGYNWDDIMWSPLWRDEYGDNSTQYWIDLAAKYVSWSGFDIEGFTSNLIAQVVEKIIMPKVDPHPKPYGHQVLAGVFSDALGL